MAASSAILTLYNSTTRIPQQTQTSSTCTRRIVQNIKLNSNISAASSSGTTEFEDSSSSKFVPLNADDPQYGPPALLLLGFDIEETAKIKELLKNLEGEFLKIIHCTEDMICRSLWEAVHAQQPNLEKAKIAKLLPRICFLSGLTGEEMMMFIDAFPETGLEPAVFAAVVPNSANKSLQELIDEVMGDHEMVLLRLTFLLSYICQNSDSYQLVVQNDAVP
ncbi:hypothetical protein ACHQM5_020637 [Ranunculus cassubicifolius]